MGSRSTRDWDFAKFQLFWNVIDVKIFLEACKNIKMDVNDTKD